MLELPGVDKLESSDLHIASLVLVTAYRPPCAGMLLVCERHAVLMFLWLVPVAVVFSWGTSALWCAVRRGAEQASEKRMAGMGNTS